MATTAHRELHAPVPSDGYVQSFARGLEVIRSFSADAPEQWRYVEDANAALRTAQ